MAAFADELGKHASSLRALARDLLADGALADDAVQETCVAALVRPPAVVGSLGEWLRAMVRGRALDLRRAETRRRHHEQRAARPEATMMPAAAEQLELQEAILAAVRSLAEPYRTAVWMRYYEQRAPSAIAAALGEPLKTVKTRLWRALRLLRQKLDRRYGDRRAWSSALLPLARGSGGPATGAAVAAGAWAMQSKHLVVAALLAFAVLGGSMLLWSGWAASPPAPVPSPMAGVNVATRSAGDAVQNRQPIDIAPQIVGVEGASPYGSLLVHVRWHDGAPAPGIAVYGDVDGEPELDRNEIRFVADDHGIARAGHVHAGPVKLSSERGGNLAAEVAAGVAREVDFVLPRGVDVKGLVLDERRLPVAGADVVLVSPRPGWRGGSVVAMTDAVGAFAVRSVDPTWSFGARKAGYAPSALVDLEDVVRAEGAGEVQVQLQFTEPGATVTGMVNDDGGKGIPDATVVLGIGQGAHREPGRSRETWSPLVVTSAADGTFGCEGIAPGKQLITAWADGCTRVQDYVQCVAGQKATVVLTIVRGVTVTGTVRNQADEGMAEVIVKCLADADLAGLQLSMDDNPHWPRPRTRTDADGRFVLRGIPPGPVHLVAAKFLGPYQFESFSRTSLLGRVGEQLVWNPVLVAGKTIRVQVRDAHGRPHNLPGGIEAFAEEPAGLANQLSSGPADLQARGRYTFSGCADVPYTICASWEEFGSEPRSLFLAGVLPGGPEVEMRLPAEPPPVEFGEVSGSVIDRSQRLRGKAMSVELSTRTSSLRVQVDGTRFSASNVPPGRYYLRASAVRDPVLIVPWFELSAGQHLDLGDLATQPGARVKIVLRTPAGVDLGKPAADLVAPRGATFGGRWPLHWDGSELVADNVSAGKCRLRYSSLDRYAPSPDLDLLADQDNVFTVDLLPAARRWLDIVLPLPDRWQHAVIALRDGAGNAVADLSLDSAYRGASPFPWQETLPFGLFTLEVVVDGERHTWPVDLREFTPTDRPLRFSLR